MWHGLLGSEWEMLVTAAAASDALRYSITSGVCLVVTSSDVKDNLCFLALTFYGEILNNLGNLKKIQDSAVLGR